VYRVFFQVLYIRDREAGLDRRRFQTLMCTMEPLTVVKEDGPTEFSHLRHETRAVIPSTTTSQWLWVTSRKEI
jgi:hypothetical protein